jgi:hypothetical protein
MTARLPTFHDPNVQGSTARASTFVRPQLLGYAKAGALMGPAVGEKPLAGLAVILAVIAAKTGKSCQEWRGWMGIEPTQDASAAPRKRF